MPDAVLNVSAPPLSLAELVNEAQRLQSAQQLAIALEITSSQLNHVQQKLNRTQNMENGI